MTDEEAIANLNHHLTTIGIVGHAQAWLLSIYSAIQVFDDVADGDTVSRPALDRVIWDVLVSMPINPFYREHAHSLAPIVGQCVLKWQTSDAMERDGKASPVSFVWRAGFYDLVLSVASIVHGQGAAIALGPVIACMYGETLETYLEEF